MRKVYAWLVVCNPLTLRFALFLLISFISISAFSQLSGTKTIGGTSPDYASFADAIADLNTQGVADPGVTFLIRSGTYSTSTGYVISTTTPAASRPVVFKPDAGASVILERTTAGSVITVNTNIGYITLDGSNNGTNSRDMTVRNTLTGTSITINFLGTNVECVVKNLIVNAGANTAANLVSTSSIGIRQHWGGGAESNNFTIENNEISNAGIGIRNEGNSTTPLMFGSIIRNNVIHTVGNTGISTQYSISPEIFGNDIQVSEGTGTSVFGIALGTAITGKFRVFNNKIYNVKTNSTSTSTTLYVAGISLSSTTTNNSRAGNIYNNFIYDINATAATGTMPVTGILISSASPNPEPDTIAFNSISLSGSNAANRISSAIAFTSSTSSHNLYLRNNILSNTLTSGTAVSIGIFKSSNSPILNSDHNNIYVGTTSATKVTGRVVSTNYAMLSDWQAGTSQDANSFDENPPFTSATDLNIPNGSVTFLESGGTPIPGVQFDINNTARNASTPDIGADEFNGSIPSCSGMPAASNAEINTTSPVCNTAIITLSLSQPYTLVDFQWQSSPDNVTWTNINGATSATYETTVTSATYFRALISCQGDVRESGSVYVTTVSALAGGTYTIDNTAPTGGTNFASFADAFSALNCQGIDGPVVFNVVAGQTFAETADLQLNYSGSATNTITFQKSGVGANPVITRLGTSATTDFILRLNGVDHYTFDGIDFTQTGSAAADWVEYGIYITNVSATDGAKHNTFKNGVITLTNGTSSARGVYMQSTPTPTDLSGTNSGNRFLNMVVQNSYVGYYFAGATNSFMEDGNEINTEGSGISQIKDLGNGTVTGSLYAVYASYQTNLKVSNTEIMNLNNGGSSLIYGIYLLSSSNNTAEISNNNIHDITAAGAIRVIYVTAGSAVTIAGNRIYNITNNTATSAATAGMDISGTGLTANIHSNRIYGMTSAGLTGTTMTGIEVGTGLNHAIHNNMISGLSAPSSTTATSGVKGIWVSGGSTGSVVKIYYNTVLLSDVGAAAAYTSSALYNSSTTPSLDIRNNIFINNSEVTTGTRAVAFWKTSTTDNIDDNSNNNLYYAGTPGTKNLIYYNATAGAQTILDYKGFTEIAPAEALSVTEDVAFAAITDGILRPDATVPTAIESGGQEIVGYATDFENDPRGPYPPGVPNSTGDAPDLGADEGVFTFVAQPVPGCADLTGPADAATGVCHFGEVVLSWTAPTTGGLVTGGYDVYFGTSATPPLVKNTSGLTDTLTGLLANTTYYWQIVPKGNSGDATGCPIYSFTTADLRISSTIPDTRCGTGTVTLGVTGSGIFNWYATPTGGSPLGTGSSFITPTINTTTTYYVSAGDGETFDGGKLAPTGTASTNLTTYTQVFEITEAITLNSVNVHSTSGTSITVSLYNSNGTQQLQTTGAQTVPTNTESTINLGWTIAPGTYRLATNGMTGNFIRDNSLTTYPYALSTYGQVTGFTSSITGSLTTSASWYFLYKWNISVGCTSPRQAVTATVTPPPAITATATSSTICEGGSTTLNVTSPNDPNYTYSWMPGSLSGASQNVSPTTTTTYTVTANDAVSGCSNTADITITVNPAPPVTATATPSTISCGGASQLLASINSPITVNGYSFMSSTGATLDPMVGATTVVSSGVDDSPMAAVEDAIGNGQAIGFDFLYEGITYTHFSASPDGWIKLQTDNSAAAEQFSNSMTSTTNIPKISPLWDDLHAGTDGAVKVLVTGTAPNRIFIVQWFVVVPRSTTDPANSTFQVWLYETTNVIEFRYGTVGNAPSSSIGLTGATATNFNSVTVSTNAASTTTANNSNAVSPSSGTMYTFTPPPAYTYAWSPAAGLSATDIANPIATVNATTQYTVTATNTSTGCSQTENVTVTVDASSFVWNGSVSANWNDAANWCNNAIPGATDNVTIPNVATLPSLAAATTVNNIDIASGASVNIIGHTLTVNGAFSGTGTIIANNSSHLVIGGSGNAGTFYMDQTNDGLTNTLNLFTMNRPGGTATLGNKMVIEDTYIPTAGTLNTGGNLHLRSTAAKTARIATASSGNYITGDVVIERNIPALGNRAWRLLSAPVQAAGAPTIYNSWQDGGSSSAQYGTHVTQQSGAGTNGFDATTVALPNNSIQYYDGTNFITPAATNTGAITDNGAAWFLFVPGNRAQDINDPGQSGNTTLRIAGTPNQGAVTAGVAGTAFSLIPNPYPSAVDYEAILTGNPTLNGVYYIWDATLGTVGAYRTVERTAANTYQQTPAGVSASADNTARYLQSGQAFFVPGSASVNFTEDMKTDQSPTINVFRTNNGTEEMLINLNIVNGTTTIADGVRAKYDAAFDAAVNAQDIAKLDNFTENLSINRGNVQLAVEKRPLIAGNDTIFLKLRNTVERNYQFEINPLNFGSTTLTAYLEDAYLATATPVSLTAPTVIDFDVNANAASADADRFRIVFTTSVLPVNYTTVKASQKNNGVQVDWSIATESNMRSYDVEKSVDGRNFVKAGTVQARQNNNNAVSYDWYDAQPVQGVNYYRIKANSLAGTAKYSQVVNVKLGGTKREMVIYPNPVNGGMVSLQLNNLPKGSYNLQLFNNLGQQVYQRRIEHPGGSATQVLDLGHVISKGIYHLHLGNAEIKLVQQIISH